MYKINSNLRFKCGIYCIFNTINGNRYIGSSVDLYTRLQTHISLLNANKSHNQHLQAAWNKYSQDSFDYSILEYCSQEDQFKKEQEYITFMKPEYNLTLNVIANLGHPCDELVKTKISNTLKKRFATGEIKTYRQDHNQKKCYVYNIHTYKYIESFPNLMEFKNKYYGSTKTSVNTKILKNNTFLGTYCLLLNQLYGLDLINYIDQHFNYYQLYPLRYLIAENINNKTLRYFKTAKSCAKYVGISESMIRKHLNATIENPYISTKAPNYKIYYTNQFIENAVLTKELEELLSGNIGETPEMDNPEITLETKESKASYSIEIEPEENIISPRVSDIPKG